MDPASKYLVGVFNNNRHNLTDCLYWVSQSQTRVQICEKLSCTRKLFTNPSLVAACLYSTFEPDISLLTNKTSTQLEGELKELKNRVYYCRLHSGNNLLYSFLMIQSKGRTISTLSLDTEANLTYTENTPTTIISFAQLFADIATPLPLKNELSTKLFKHIPFEKQNIMNPSFVFMSSVYNPDQFINLSIRPSLSPFARTNLLIKHYKITAKDVVVVAVLLVFLRCFSLNYFYNQ